MRRRAIRFLIGTLLVVVAATAPGAAQAKQLTDWGQAAPASSIAVTWQRIAIRTIYTEGASAPPVGALYLAFTSLAVHDAAREGQRHGMDAAAAAVAVAAHDVLYEYFPGSRPNLDSDLAASLATVSDGKQQDIGVGIGEDAAEETIASRVGDGRNDPSIVYSKAPAPGIWQPAPGGVMAAAWLGFVDPVVDVAPTPVDGPDPLTSAAYAADYNEVRAVGNVGSETRTAEQTAISQFFAANPLVMYRDALCRYLDAEPLGLLPTTRLFARIDAAVANSFIQTWRLKFDVGFWRPFQAIALADTDGNPATNPQAGWIPLVPNPSYSEYTSGHAAATSPFAEVLRRTLGDSTPLLLRAGSVERSYATLTALEHDALNARIWGGLHFRDAMDDGYYLGHTTADRMMQVIR
jgi:hypothetical protein